MKQLGIYVAVLVLLSSCANQGNMAYYDDDGIYARPAGSNAAAASGAEDAYYFVDEGQGSEAQRDGEYYGGSDGDLATTDDYVPEARSLPSESGRAYNDQRYNSPTYSAGYASAMPITMRMGYSSFHSPIGFGGGVGVGVGFGYMDPWWGMGIYDPWHPWYRWNRWNSWYAWNMWSPFGLYGGCFGGWGYGMGYNTGFGMGYYMGMNSYNNGWAGESSNHNLVNGPRPGFMGGGFGSSGGTNMGSFSGINRGGSEAVSNRTPAPARGNTPSRFDSPSRADSPSRTDGIDLSKPNTRTPNPNSTRTPSARPDNSRSNDRSPFRWNTPRDNNRPNTQPAPSRSPRPNSGYSPPSRGGSSPSMRPGSSSPSRNYSRPSTPSRSPSMSPSSPSRSSGGSRSGGGGSRGGFRR